MNEFTSIQDHLNAHKDAPSLSGQSKHSLSSKSTLDWDVYVGDRTFSQKLIANVIPHLFRSQARKVFELMDNVLCFDDLKSNFEFLAPEDVIDLFPSKEEFLNNIGGVIAVTLIPRVVQETKDDPNILMVRSQQHTHARSLMDEYLINNVYTDVKNMYENQ